MLVKCCLHLSDRLRHYHNYDKCSSVCQDPVYLSWKPFVKTWIDHLPSNLPRVGQEYLEAMFNYCIDRGLAFVRQYRNLLTIPVPEMAIIRCLCGLLSAYFDFMIINGGFGIPGNRTFLKTFYVRFALMPIFLVFISRFRF